MGAGRWSLNYIDYLETEKCFDRAGKRNMAVLIRDRERSRSCFIIWRKVEGPGQV